MPYSGFGDGQFVWGKGYGLLSDQSDLQAVLSGKLGSAGDGSLLTGLTKTQVGLANCDNTSDANKPVSSATHTALNLKANLISPAFTTPGLGVATATSLTATGAISSSGTAGIGYATGAGGTVTQATNRTTGVTLNKTTGSITLVSAAGSTTIQSFTVTNSTVSATDVVIVKQRSGTDLYRIYVTAIAAGSFRISYATLSGTTTEQPVFNFVVIKGVTA